MIQKKDLPQQTKRKGILALFWEGFLEGFNTPKEEQPQQLSKQIEKNELIVSKSNNYWDIFMEGFKEEWNKKSFNNKKTLHGNEVFCIELADTSFSEGTPDCNDYTHPQYDDFWGNNTVSNRK